MLTIILFSERKRKNKNEECISVNDRMINDKFDFKENHSDFDYLVIIAKEQQEKCLFFFFTKRTILRVFVPKEIT